jgi:hypothetical protein
MLRYTYTACLVGFKRAQKCATYHRRFKGVVQHDLSVCAMSVLSVCDDMFYSFLNSMLGRFIHGEVVYVWLCFKDMTMYFRRTL